MRKYVVKYEEWDKEKIKELGVLLNNFMTTLDMAYGSDNLEQSWLRKFERDLVKLITKED